MELQLKFGEQESYFANISAELHTLVFAHGSGEAGFGRVEDGMLGGIEYTLHAGLLPIFKIFCPKNQIIQWRGADLEWQMDDFAP